MLLILLSAAVKSRRLRPIAAAGHTTPAPPMIFARVVEVQDGSVMGRRSRRGQSKADLSGFPRQLHRSIG